MLLQLTIFCENCKISFNTTSLLSIKHKSSIRVYFRWPSFVALVVLLIRRFKIIHILVKTVDKPGISGSGVPL